MKDAIHDYVVHGAQDAVNPSGAAPRPRPTTVLTIPAGGRRSCACACRASTLPRGAFGPEFDALFAERVREADEFYAALATPGSLRGRPRRAAPGVRRAALVQAVLPLRRRPLARGDPGAARAAARAHARPQLATGRTSTTPTSSRCPTSGSTPGTPPGISPSTASRSRWSTPTSRRSSSCCCCASGTCTPTASSRPTSGRSAT